MAMRNMYFTKYDKDFEELKSIANIKELLSKNTDLEEVKVDDLLGKICVSPPYFIFNKIYKYNNLLISPLKPEQVIGYELAPISIGESGRHMAILGTCACAINEEEKFFYLVKDAAIWKNEDCSLSYEKDRELFLIVKPRFIDKKTVGSSYILVDGFGNII